MEVSLRRDWRAKEETLSFNYLYKRDDRPVRIPVITWEREAVNIVDRYE